MRVKIYTDLDDLPAGYDLLFDQAGSASYFHSRSWFRALIDTTSNAGETLRLYGVEPEAEGAPAKSLLVNRASSEGSWPLKRRSLSSFTNFYTMRGGPVLAPGAEDADDAIRSQIKAICAERPRWDVVFMDLLDPDLTNYETLVQAFRAEGMMVQTFFRHGCWYEDFAGRSFEEYLAARGASIRKKLTWKNRKALKSDRFRYELVTGEEGLPEAIRAYQTVYDRSWKEPEQYPEFIPRLIEECARLGTLRLSLMYFDDQPIATQLTFLSGNKAFQYKMAYDQQVLKDPFTKNLSIGSLMLLRIIEHLIEVDGVGEVDLGVGDEGFKSEWCTGRRESWGIMAFNARTLPGLAGAARHLGGARLSAAKRRLSGILRRPAPET